MEKIKTYTNDEITVVWKPNLCIHSKNCVKGSPLVFKPKERPWIQVEQAPSGAVMKTIDTCPSGALSYHNNGEGENLSTTNTDKAASAQVMENGPLVVEGTLEITHTDGQTETREGRSAFCRCGKTGNMPFCDGSHNK